MSGSYERYKGELERRHRRIETAAKVFSWALFVSFVVGSILIEVWVESGW